MYKNSIITATNSLYYDSLLTLISSIHKTSINIIDQIFVYNLGLSDLEINNLKRIKKVTILEFSDTDKNLHPKFMEPKSYVYKIYCMKQGSNFSENILWIDSGAMLLKSCENIFDIIQKNGIFLVGDNHKNKDYTHSDCIRIMCATEKEINDFQLWAGVVGYNKTRYFNFINEAFKYAMIPGCLDGNQENHRHDQSILSILASRYEIDRHNIDIYGYWTDINRNLNKAINIGSIIFAHRRGHSDIKDIIYD